jgi:hypothetical protein
MESSHHPRKSRRDKPEGIIVCMTHQDRDFLRLLLDALTQANNPLPKTRMSRLHRSYNDQRVPTNGTRLRCEHPKANYPQIWASVENQTQRVYPDSSKQTANARLPPSRSS